MKIAGWIGAAVALALLLFVPLHINGYWLNLLYQTVLYVGLAYGFNIISGYAGYFSFGQIAFFGIGAYTTGALVLSTHWDWTICALIGGVLCGVLAVPIGAVMLRLRGPFFAIGMLGLAQTARVLASSSSALGGGSGMYLPPGSSLLPVYYWTLAIAGGAFAVTWWIDHSAFGLRLQAIREDEAIAATLGVATTRAKVYGLHHQRDHPRTARRRLRVVPHLHRTDVGVLRAGRSAVDRDDDPRRHRHAVGSARRRAY